MNDPMTEAWETVARWEGGEGRCWYCGQWMPQALFPLHVKMEHPDRWRDFEQATREGDDRGGDDDSEGPFTSDGPVP